MSNFFLSCFSQVGDGTTSVVLLAGELLQQAKPFVEESLHPQVIVRSYRQALQLVGDLW